MISFAGLGEGVGAEVGVSAGVGAVVGVVVTGEVEGLASGEFVASWFGWVQLANNSNPTAIAAETALLFTIS